MIELSTGSIQHLLSSVVPWNRLCSLILLYFEWNHCYRFCSLTPPNVYMSDERIYYRVYIIESLCIFAQTQWTRQAHTHNAPLIPLGIWIMLKRDFRNNFIVCRHHRQHAVTTPHTYIRNCSIARGASKFLHKWYLLFAAKKKTQGCWCASLSIPFNSIRRDTLQIHRWDTNRRLLELGSTNLYSVFRTYAVSLLNQRSMWIAKCYWQSRVPVSICVITTCAIFVSKKWDKQWSNEGESRNENDVKWNK